MVGKVFSKGSTFIGGASDDVVASGVVVGKIDVIGLDVRYVDDAKLEDGEAGEEVVGEREVDGAEPSLQMKILLKTTILSMTSEYMYILNE